MKFLCRGFAIFLWLAIAGAMRWSNDAIAQPLTTKLLPLPVYATLPNEGDTFGLMPVFLRVRADSEVSDSIYAPSITWNDVIKVTGTFRWYHYPSDFESMTWIASASTHANWGSLFLWQRLPSDAGRATDELSFRVQRSIFFRFFGIGPNADDSAETSHTRIRGSLSYRRGINIADHLNLGASVDIARDLVQNEGVPNIALSQEVFPSAPGMTEGATILGQSIDLRYDTRMALDYSTEGLFADLSLGPVEGLGNVPSFLRYRFETKALVRESNRLQMAARVLWKYVSSPDVPFYYQSSLGGSYLLRGYTEDRFTDQGAWTAEIEQRIRIFRTHIYGVTTDWRIDPFVSVGQVYHDAAKMFSCVRLTAGLGFRAWVRPNVLGRVDVATAGNGAKFYVEMGYPF